MSYPSDDDPKNPKAEKSISKLEKTEGRLQESLSVSSEAPSPRFLRELPTQLPELRALYYSLGSSQEERTQKLSNIVLDFYQRMSADLLVGFFFSGRDLPTIAAKQAEFLLRAMGGAESYSGKAPADAHKQLPPILSGHMDRRLKILEHTLMDHGLSKDKISAWIGFENAFRSGIVST